MDELSEAVRELIEACDEADKWPQILTGELQKAREVQAGNLPLLTGREIEGAVLSTFPTLTAAWAESGFGGSLPSASTPRYRHDFSGGGPF